MNMNIGDFSDNLLNEEEFNYTIADTERLRNFVSNPGYVYLITAEQLEIINSLL
jgi:hypothetical protein